MSEWLKLILDWAWAIATALFVGALTWLRTLKGKVATLEGNVLSRDEIMAQITAAEKRLEGRMDQQHTELHASQTALRAEIQVMNRDNQDARAKLYDRINELGREIKNDMGKLLEAYLGRNRS